MPKKIKFDEVRTLNSRQHWSIRRAWSKRWQNENKRRETNFINCWNAKCHV